MVNSVFISAGAVLITFFIYSELLVFCQHSIARNPLLWLSLWLELIFCECVLNISSEMHETSCVSNWEFSFQILKYLDVSDGASW